MTALMLANPNILMGITAPQLIIESPESLRPIAKRLRGVDPQIFLATMDLVGLKHPGPPIRVILAQDGSSLALQAPAWASGYALSQASTIVLLTDRVANYPYDSIEGVLFHEIGHILTHWAAGEHHVPRWFDEGLAMIAARTWDLEDRARLVWAMVSDTQISLDELNELFLKDGASARRAYVLAHAFTSDLLEQTGPDFPQHILALIAKGMPFHEAFAKTAFMTLHRAQEQFWNRQTLWNRWIPVATSSAMLWLVITLLVFYTFKKQRKRTTAIRKQWKKEEIDHDESTF